VRGQVGGQCAPSRSASHCAAHRAGRVETTGSAAVAREDLSRMGAYSGGPIYILCARPDRVLDIFGPIEVVR
jgi:hypothetical protein